MKKPGEFDVVGQVEWRKYNRPSIFFKIIGCLGLLVSLGEPAKWLWAKYHKPAEWIASGSGTITFAGTTSTGVFYHLKDTQPPKYIAIPDGDIRDAFRAAVEEWRIALGGTLPIKYPRLAKVEGNDCSNTHLMAEAQMELNRVIFCDPNQGGDLKSLMMHEVGHLLGVPHIDQDDLMNAYENGAKVDKPTPFAIAIAKAAHAK